MSSKPFSWNAYEHGRQRINSVSSQSSGRSTRIHFAEDEEDREHRQSTEPRRSEDQAASLRRRSSIGLAMNHFAHIGGVNSIQNYTRSWQRAAAFHEIAPSRGSFAVAVDEDAADATHDVERTVKPRRSMLRQQIERYGSPAESAVIDVPGEHEGDYLDPNMPLLGRSPSRGVFHSPFSSSFTGGTYGSFSSREELEQRQQATKAYLDEVHTHAADSPEKDREPLLIQQVEQPDGKISIEVIGQSTIYQTILNSSNVLIGVGILSLPLGIRYAGWLMGLVMLTLAAFATAYTARLLAKCLDVDKAMITYSDIALFAFGKPAEIVVGLLFTFELLTANVALVVLFGDSLHLLLPQYGGLEFKILAGIISIPLAFVPLRYLGITSMLGIVCCFSIIILVLTAGLIKPDSPGSLLDPAVTYLFPQHWSTLPLSLGLVMSPWGGHAVFPQFYRDMRHPRKYGKAVTVTFSLTYAVDAAIAIIGLLMFGDLTRAEITSNVFETKGYPKIISLLLVVCIAIIPLTKLPLNAQPVFSVVESLMGIRQRYYEIGERSERSKFTLLVMRVAARIGVLAVITIVAIVCPGFDRVMSFMGSLFCMVICICFPVAFYLKLCNSEVGLLQKALLWFMGLTSLVLAIIGTVWAFLPSALTKAR